MSAASVTFLALVFFITSAVCVVTGSTSIITVPVMLNLGIDPKVAVATNMFALTFMSIGGTLPFLKSGFGNRNRLAPLIGLTLAGSIIGALLLVRMPASAIRIVVSVAVIGLAIFSAFYRQTPTESIRFETSRRRELAGYALTFLLGIYGGLFSGGYVTILTTAFLVTFRMTLLEAIAITKLVNIFSSGVATLVFIGHGLVDYRLGAILALAMFAGAWLGAGYARQLSETWLRRIYLTAVWLLGLKALIFDVFGGSSPEASPSR